MSAACREPCIESCSTSSYRGRRVCLAVPGQIVEIVDHEHRLARFEVAGMRRDVNVRPLSGDGFRWGEWISSSSRLPSAAGA